MDNGFSFYKEYQGVRNIAFKNGCDEFYSSFLEDYNTYISLSKNLIETLGVKDNCLLNAWIAKKLILIGTFSYNSKFTRRMDAKDVLPYMSGVNIVDGFGSHKHICEFMFDIVPNLGVFPCVMLESRDKQRGLVENINYMVNVVDYNGVCYGFDSYNHGNLYKFISEYEMLPILEDKSGYMHYKPYYEICNYGKSFEDVRRLLEIYKESSHMDSITKEEYSEIIRTAIANIQTNMGMVQDFTCVAKEPIDRIKKKIKEIKINR